MVFHFSQVLGMSEYDFHIAILNGIQLYMYIMCQLYSVILHNHSSFFILFIILSNTINFYMKLD